MILLRSVPIPKFMVAALAALALATGSMTPTQTRAGTEELLGAIVVIGAACAISGKCSGKNRKKGGRSAGARGGQGGYGDAVALNRQQARLIQEGLASQGYYTGAIDGALGKGSRQAIRTYQSATGAKVTGVLTGEQINTLAALSPSYAGLPPNSPALFEVDIARDTNRDELRTIQAGLNAKGYNAGPVDGSMGGKTRTAIAAYKADHGLPGAPIPSRRLIARCIASTATTGSSAGLPFVSTHVRRSRGRAPKPTGDEEDGGAPSPGPVVEESQPISPGSLRARWAEFENGSAIQGSGRRCRCGG